MAAASMGKKIKVNLRAPISAENHRGYRFSALGDHEDMEMDGGAMKEGEAPKSILVMASSKENLKGKVRGKGTPPYRN